MKHIVLFALLVGCGSTPTPDVTLPILPTDSGGEAPAEPLVEPERAEVDTIPPLMSEPSGREVLLPMAVGASAPFPGVLLNDEAVAWLEAEPDVVQERAQLFLDRRLQEVRFRLLAETERLQLRIRTMESEHTIIVSARDEQIASLTRINDQLRSGPIQWWENVLYIGGALVVGVIVGIVVTALSN